MDVHTADLIPTDADLPGTGWLAVDEGFAAASSQPGVAELFDCVTDDFPDDAVTESVSSPHFVRPPSQVLHGLGVGFADVDAAETAVKILSSRRFADCLGRSISADVDGVSDAELLAVDVTETASGHRVTFTGSDGAGVRPVHLEVVALRFGEVVTLLWCGDSPEPFAGDDLGHVVRAIGTRAPA